MALYALMKANPISTLKTVCICLAFASVGLQAGILGPALLDLKIQTMSPDLSSVTWIVTGRGIGFAAGSAIAGSIEPFVNLQLLMAFALVLSGVMYLVIPLTNILAVSITCGSLAGVFQGIVDTASNVLILKIWSSDCPPFLQAVFSSYGIGSLMGPLIVRPFLILKEDVSDQESPLDNSTIVASTNLSSCPIKFDGHCPGDINLRTPFLVTFVIPIGIAAAFVYLFIAHRHSFKRDLPPPTFHPSANRKAIEESGNGQAIVIGQSMAGGQQESIKPTINRTMSYQRQMSAHSHKRTISILSSGNESTVSEPWTPAKIVVIALVSIFAFFFTGMEQGIGTYIPAFGVGSDLKMYKRDAAFISSIFWGSLTFFQVVSIPITAWIGVNRTIWCNLFNSVLAGVMFMFSDKSPIVFMVASAYIGISYASTWGALFAFLESRFTVTGFIVAILTVTSCVGQSLAVALIGILIDTMPIAFPTSVLVSNATMFVIFTVIFFICKKYFPMRN